MSKSKEVNTVEFAYSIQDVGAQTVTITAPEGTPRPETVEDVFALMDLEGNGVDVDYGDSDDFDRCFDSTSKEAVYCRDTERLLPHEPGDKKHVVIVLHDGIPNEYAHLCLDRSSAISKAKKIIKENGYDPSRPYGYEDMETFTFEAETSYIQDDGKFEVCVLEVAE
jgi:hypothetical protein